MTNQEASFILANIDRRVCDDELNEALDMAIKVLEQEPSGDLINREYLFNVLDDFCGHDRTATITLDTLADLVYGMPSVKQEPKTGRWIKSNPFTKPYCSKCGEPCFGLHGFDCITTDYCPNCGAKMVDEQESEG